MQSINQHYHFRVLTFMLFVLYFQQYSALLTQYKFNHFGGFKIAKVLDEYKRGKQTVSVILKIATQSKQNKGHNFCSGD